MTAAGEAHTWPSTAALFTFRSSPATSRSLCLRNGQSLLPQQQRGRSGMSASRASSMCVVGGVRARCSEGPGGSGASGGGRRACSTCVAGRRRRGWGGPRAVRAKERGERERGDQVRVGVAARGRACLHAWPLSMAPSRATTGAIPARAPALAACLPPASSRPPPQPPLCAAMPLAMPRLRRSRRCTRNGLRCPRACCPRCRRPGAQQRAQTTRLVRAWLRKPGDCPHVHAH
jgi:hypothetical protein